MLPWDDLWRAGGRTARAGAQMGQRGDLPFRPAYRVPAPQGGRASLYTVEALAAVVFAELLVGSGVSRRVASAAARRIDWATVLSLPPGSDCYIAAWPQGPLAEAGRMAVPVAAEICARADLARLADRPVGAEPGGFYGGALVISADRVRRAVAEAARRVGRDLGADVFQMTGAGTDG